MGAARRFAADLLERGPQSVIIKMGHQGALIASRESAIEIEGHQVEAVDTTGAGDVFNGALAVALSEGEDLVTAATFANAAAALSVTLPGAMASIPNRKAVDEFIQQRAREMHT
jgi:ribokinase